MTITRTLATLILSFATLLVTAGSARADLFGQGGGGPVVGPGGPRGSNVVVAPPGHRVPAASWPAGSRSRGRMQASRTYSGAEIFGGSRSRWSAEAARLAASARQQVAQVRAFEQRARAARSRADWRRAADYSRQLRSTATRLIQRYRQAELVLALWDRTTTFTYYDGPNDRRYPIVSDPATYLRANPRLIGGHVVARHP